MFFLTEAEKRKKRSINILKVEEVPFIKSLPVISDSTNTKLQSEKDVCDRTVLVGLLAAVGEGLEDEYFWEWVDDFKLRNKLTKDEKEFIDLDDRDDLIRAKFTWRYECFWVLLWSLGFIESLYRPDSICDVKKAVGFLQAQSPVEFYENAKLRDVSEILDMADLVLRYHWAARNVRVNGYTNSSGINEEVVMEWHYALNWLINAFDEDWDNVSTHT